MTAPDPFVVGAVAVVVLAQVPLVAYLSRHVALEAGAERPDASKGYVTYGTVDARPASNAGGAGDDGGRAGEDAVACRACGSVVDASYDVCGACATRLPAAHPPGGERR